MSKVIRISDEVEESLKSVYGNNFNEKIKHLLSIYKTINKVNSVSEDKPL